MQFLVFLTALATASLSTAKPIEKRQLGGVLLCTGAQSTGECTHQVVSFGTCTNLTAPYLTNTSTFAPDGEEQYCYPYLYPCGGICKSPEGCTLGAVSYNSTAKTNLAAAGGWNELIESFECYQGVAPQV
ncbi:hypothetical protein N0V82_008914 [Gnomoniopsis sp. IMI 355080]|nr:hypothetical protein N0V82_008914 [Gnomoniopsis sp. IMI 355080]